MSLIRIFLNPLDGSDKEEYKVSPGTRIIDFLQEHYPNGFDGIIRVFCGIEEIELEDLDRVIVEHEQVSVLVMPSGAFAAAALPYLIQALVSVAIGYVINLIFKPSAPSSLNQESESPVYSINASRNAARLGDPISVHYGTVSWPPDYAAAPYVWYWRGANDMYVDELLCLGHGKFDIEQVYIGDTPITAIDPTSVRYWLFDSSQHNQTMGSITNQIWSDIRDTAVPFPFREDVFTSPEVESFEIGGDRSEPVDVPTGFAGSAFATYIDGVSGETILGHLENVDSSLDIRAGDTLTLAGSTSNNGDFLIGSVVIDPDTPGIMSLFQDTNTPTEFADEDPLNAATTYVLNTGVPVLSAGPFRAQKLGQEIDKISIDIIFAQGLYRVDGSDGTIKTNPVPVDMEYTCQRIDELTGDPIDAPLVFNESFTEKIRQPVRSTFDTGPIPAGAYEVTVTRLTEISNDDRTHDAVTWAGLKGAGVWQVDPVYGDVTMLAIRMKATNGLGTAARSRIRVTAKRIFDTGDSSNPITAIKDVWTNTTYGLGRDINDLDLDVLDAYEVEWATTGPYFNGSFDQRATGFDGMQNIASLAGAKIVQDGGLTSIVLDKWQDVRTAMFTSANIVSGSVEIRYTFDTEGDYDSVQVEYRDATSFQPSFVTYPIDGLQPDTFTLFGCTDDAYAEEFANYLYNVKTQRRKLVRFQTELEGLIPRFGDRIAVSTPLADWGQSGVVVNVVDPQTIEVDQDLDWTADNVMMLRDPMGAPGATIPVTQGATPNIAVLDTIPAVEVNGPQSIEPTNYAFGTTTDFVRDFMMTKMTPKGDTLVEIEGQNYLDTIYDGAPPHMNPCVVTVPDTDIPSTSIWDETDAELPIFYFYGVVGVDGDEIIAAPSGRKIIHSTNRGQTWSVYPDSLPDDPSYPDDDAHHLVPSKWVKSGSTWFAHLRSKVEGTANDGSVIGSTFDGSAWNIGPKLTGDIGNGRYSVGNLIIDGGNAVLFGRPFTPNNAEVWKYGDQYGASPNPLQQFSIASNSNGIGGIANWQNGGYLGIVFQSGNNLFNTWSIDRSCTDGDRYVNYTWGNTTSARYADNSKGVAVFGNWMTTADINSDGFAVLTTSALYDSDIVTASRTATGEAMIASKPNIWLAAGSNSGDFGRWTLEYSLETTPTSFTYPCNVILPDNHTSSGTNGQAWWIGASGDGWWIGWYRKASDQKLRIFKFEFEAYSGGCG